MPALPSPGKVVRLKYIFAFSDGGPLCHVRPYYSYSGTNPSIADCQTLANAVMTDANTNLAGLFGSWITLDGVEVTDLSSATGSVNTSSHAPIAGTNSGSALPQEVAACFRYQVGRRYRGGHPKEFWPFGVQANMTDELDWTSAFITAMDTDMTTHVGNIVGQVFGGSTITAKVNISYYEGFTVFTGVTGRARNVSKARTTPIVDDVSILGLLGKISTQRRRRGRV